MIVRSCLQPSCIGRGTAHQVIKFKVCTTGRCTTKIVSRDTECDVKIILRRKRRGEHKNDWTEGTLHTGLWGTVKTPYIRISPFTVHCFLFCFFPFFFFIVVVMCDCANFRRGPAWALSCDRIIIWEGFWHCSSCAIKAKTYQCWTDRTGGWVVWKISFQQNSVCEGWMQYLLLPWFG